MFKKLINTAMIAIMLMGTFDASAGKYGGSKGFSSSKSSFSFGASKTYKKHSWGGSGKSKPSASSGSSVWGGSSKKTSYQPKTIQQNSGSKSNVNASKTATGAWGGNKAGTGSKPINPAAKNTQLAKAPTKHFVTKKQKMAYSAYQQKQQSKFKGQANKVDQAKVSTSPLYQKAANRSDKADQTYWDRRERVYGGWSAPTYVYHGSPSYGAFDGMFLGYMLGHATSPSYSSFAYHHQNDPGMSAWMNEMETRASEDTQLRTQLDELKRQMAQMKGTKIDPAYLPEGIDADMVIAPDVVANMKPVFRLCTASLNGNYNKFGQYVKLNAFENVDVQIVNTKGSMQNLEYMETGKCDGSFVQRNAFTTYAERHPSGEFNFERIATPALEYAHMACNRKSGVSNVGDLIGKKLLVDNIGSGTEVTWSDFASMDPNYEQVTVEFEGGIRALNDVAIGNADCMLYVASLNTELMKKANTLGDKIVLVPVNDWDFNKKEYGKGKSFKGHQDQSGEDIYVFRDIPGGQYDNIMDGYFFTSVETLTVPVDMVASLSWSEKNGKAYDGLLNAVMQSQKSIDQLTQQN